MLFAAGLLVLLASLLTGISAAASGSGVKIKGQPLISPQEIKQAQDVNGTDYTIRPQAGSKGTTKSLSGTSIESLVGTRGLTAGDFSYLTFPGPGGTTIFLSSKDIFEHSKSFPEGPALVSVKSGVVRFFRPVRGRSKRNASDEVRTNPGQTLSVGSEKDGHVLGVTVTTSDPKPDKGDTVELTAKATGKTLPNEKVRFTWRFSDHGTANGETVEHTISDSGAVLATATAVGTRGSGGQASVTLKAGKVKPSGTDESSTTASGNAHDGNSSSATGTATDPGTSYPSPDYSYLNTPGYPGYNSGLGLPPTGSPPGQSESQAPPGPTDTTQATQPLAPNLETVSGTLVTNLSGAPGSPSRSDSAPAAASEPAAASVVDFNQDSSSSSLTLPLSGAGVALLLVAGAGRELQRSRRRPA